MTLAVAKQFDTGSWRGSSGDDGLALVIDASDVEARRGILGADEADGADKSASAVLAPARAPVISFPGTIAEALGGRNEGAGGGLPESGHVLSLAVLTSGAPRSACHRLPPLIPMAIPPAATRTNEQAAIAAFDAIIMSPNLFGDQRLQTALISLPLQVDKSPIGQSV